MSRITSSLILVELIQQLQTCAMPGSSKCRAISSDFTDRIPPQAQNPSKFENNVPEPELVQLWDQSYHNLVDRWARIHDLGNFLVNASPT